MVGCSKNCYFHPTIYVAARPRVGLLPICREAAGYAFNRSPRLHAEDAIHRDNQGVEAVTLLEESLQVLPLLLLLRRLEEIIWRLVLVGEGVSVHDTDVINTVRPYISEVAYQQISLLLQRLIFHSWIVEK